MGYQVGNTCYATKQDADNVYFSLVAPVIISQKTNTVATYPPVKFLKRLPPKQPLQNGGVELIRPEYIKGQWFLQGKVININYPSCDASKNFIDGYELGWAIFGVMAACYFVIIIKRLLR